ncbi:MULTISPECIES: galactosyltransferase-related protein [Saccharothrix]|uniref:galactosyltransferase-related protein n=1 Tax=Saccharothrix TaxID=2071 RepID=UPI00093FB77E|nr:galactosyltransferase-related protein [Saccharothrix sp. CB00851]
MLADPRPRLNDHSWQYEQDCFERAVAVGLAHLSPVEREQVNAVAADAAREEGDRVALDRLVRLLTGVAGDVDATASIWEVDRQVATRFSPGRGLPTGAVVTDVDTPPAVEDCAMTFVVPFRASTEDRMRNLSVALRALRDATREAPDVEVTIVEQDTDTRLSGIPRDLYDTHIFTPHGGLYNKSWSVNTGVTRSAHDKVCVLDADLLVDRHVVASIHTGLDHSDLFIPHSRVVWMDETTTARTIAAITAATGEYRVDGSAARGSALDDCVGACLAVRRDFYRSIGGHDERYEGWGGEDIAFHERAAAHGRTDRGNLVMAHLNHTRAASVRDDGSMFNSHLPGTSADDRRIGRIHKYRSALATSGTAR